MPWTQEQAIAFEAARECIGHLIAIRISELHTSSPAPERAAELEADLARLQTERRALRLTDEAEIARIREEYGAQVRAWRQAA
ncbi:hypothetical protein KAK06_22045 [Ideonella sp. 4Y11]|uniref:Uncharacterized protein n=1 Tax=Ideonella aquatica TaxID=2824119 RepID=A0A940YJY3_9BURK|nr:hypothetical protein [Ideonella aquatica]MBQ0961638.1 hypothetical protein [Ideonella aquatica]